MTESNFDLIPPPNPWLQAIRALASAQRFIEAEQKALDWTMSEPVNPEAWRQLASMRECQKNYQGSLEAAEESVRFDSSNSGAWWYRGYQNLLVLKPYQAELDFDKALELSKSSGTYDYTLISHFMRAQARSQLGDYQGAIEDCLLVPGDASFWLHQTITPHSLLAHCEAALRQGSDIESSED